LNNNKMTKNNSKNQDKT